MDGGRYQNGQAIRLQTSTLVNGGGVPQTGLATVTVRVLRESDGFWLDWADGVFKAAGWTTLDGAMAELDATRAPGVYFRAFPTVGYADDRYYFRMTSSTPAVQNVPQEAAAIVGEWVDNLDAAVSTRAVPGDAMDLIAGAVDAAAIATDAIDADAIAASAVTEIQAGLATSAAVAAIQADTDDIQTRLPASLSAGRMRSQVEGMDAGTVTAAAVATDAFDADALAADAVEEIRIAVRKERVVSSFALNSTTNLLTGNAWLERDGELEIAVTSLALQFRDADGVVLFTPTIAGPDARGVFKITQAAPPGLTQGAHVQVDATITPTVGATVRTITGIQVAFA